MFCLKVTNVHAANTALTQFDVSQGMRMTPNELRWFRSALDALESGDCSSMAKQKILRTLSQIAARAASDIEMKFIERVDEQLRNQ
jgi:hypothetical protein